MGDVVMEQSSVLSQLNPTVEKEVIFNGKTEKGYDIELDWKKELGMLTQYNLRSQKLKGLYTEERVTMENGNILVKYKAVAGESTTITNYQVIMDPIERPIMVFVQTEDSTFAGVKKESVQLNFALFNNVYPILSDYRFSKKSFITQVGEENIEVHGKIIFDDHMDKVTPYPTI